MAWGSESPQFGSKSCDCESWHEGEKKIKWRPLSRGLMPSTWKRKKKKKKNIKTKKQKNKKMRNPCHIQNHAPVQPWLHIYNSGFRNVHRVSANNLIRWIFQLFADYNSLSTTNNQIASPGRNRVDAIQWSIPWSLGYSYRIHTRIV